MPNPQGVVNYNRANETTGHHIHNYSNFDRGQLSYKLYNTLRFGDYTPSFVMEGVERDEISVNTKDIIDSLSLNAPFKGSIRKIKESFMVPLMSILPMNWDRIYVQPSNGDDVPDTANCVLKDFPARYANFWSYMYNEVKSSVPDSATYSESLAKGFYTALVRLLVAGEYIYSYGSLPHVVGYKIGGTFSFVLDGLGRLCYDDFFDEALKRCFRHIKLFSVQWKEGAFTRSRSFLGLSSQAKMETNVSSFRNFLEFLRENPLCWIDTVTFDSTFGVNPDWQAVCSDLHDSFLSTSAPYGLFTGSLYIDLPTATSDDLMDLNQTNFNLSRIFAYQIVCAHYYSNSSIDVVYTAELYRQYIYSIFCSIYGVITDTFTFLQNGMRCQYDILSGRMLGSLIYRNYADNAADSLSYTVLCLRDPNNASFKYLYRLAGLSAIFGFRKSLRYGDYFVGARPRPLAPINTDVSVNSNLVSVIDITRKIQVQRFANSVMRSRQKIEEYVKSLFGSAPAPDYHNPFFLTREEEIVYGDEVQNTADAQVYNPNSRTANLASNAGQFTFTFHNDDMHPCIYLQIISFDIRRAYTRSCERQFFIKDRFDMFNPDFQYVGDQSVYGMELGWPQQGGGIPTVFGYQTRDEEYKQRFDQASGGFVKNLPGWILTDQDQSKYNSAVVNISPDFIRSYNTELDQFFLELTGLSLGNYFHFVCITHNNVSAKRAMAVDPQILQ